MPREPIPLIRQGGFLNAEKLFILSYEGSVSERKYFNDFRNSELFNDSGLIEIIPLKRPKNAGTDPISVKRLLKKAKDEFMAFVTTFVVFRIIFLLIILINKNEH